MVSIESNHGVPLFERSAFGFRSQGEVPAIGKGKFRLKHHAEFIGGLEVFLGWSPTVMANVVETVLAGEGEAA